MSLSTPTTPLLIVTGSTLRAEELDRPLAYYLKQQLEPKLACLASGSADGTHPNFRIYVISDLRWVGDQALQSFPTITIGGPRVNMLGQSWIDELPIALAYSDQYCIQLDPKFEDVRVSIWGRNNSTTQIAVAVFLHRYASPFLERCGKLSPGELYPEHDSTDSGELSS
jgi:hypothetical protein